MKHLFIFITPLLLSTLALGSDNNSDNLTVPHTFNSGETISSSKMNENFEAVENHINNSGYFKVLSNGSSIGYLLDIDAEQLVVINSKGFIFKIGYEGYAGGPNINQTTYFETTNCNGDGVSENISRFTNIIQNGYGGLYHIDLNLNKKTIFASSKLVGVNCSAHSGSVEGYIIKLNNESITNVKTEFDTPIIIAK